MQINVSFSYLDKTISVKCKDDDDIKEIYKKFVSSLRDKSDITHYIYLYNNNKLENTGKIKDDKYIGGGKSNINIVFPLVLQFRFVMDFGPKSRTKCYIRAIQ